MNKDIQDLDLKKELNIVHSQIIEIMGFYKSSKEASRDAMAYFRTINDNITALKRKL